MSRNSRIAVGVIATAAAVGAALVPATQAFAAAPSITVTVNEPDPSLLAQDGDTVTVSGTGFPASTTVYVSECSTSTGTASNCDQTPADGGVTAGSTDASGAFTISNLVVRTETLGSASCGAGDTCYVGATTDPTAPNPATNTAIGSFKFDRLQMTPRTGLTNGQSVSLTGGNFAANSQVYVSECTSLDPAQAQQKCDFNSVKVFPTDDKGAFTGAYPVHTGVVGADGSTCNPGATCVLAATDNILDPANGNIGGGLITFANITPTSLSAKATKSSVAAGKGFAIKGALKAAGAGLNGATVKLFKVTSSGAKSVASKTTATSKSGTKGFFKFAVKQKKTTKYQVRFGGGTIAGTLYGASKSKVLKVTT